MNSELILQMRAALFAVALMFSLATSCFAAFPSTLVIDGEICPGSVYSDGSGNDFAVYYSTDYPVIVLYGETGGAAAIGPDMDTALNSPTTTGTWDGGMNVNLPGPYIVFPQVLVYYPSPVTPAVMQGYDGNQIWPVASGFVNSQFVVLYAGLPDGYIFDFDSQQPIYRYQAGVNPVTIDTTNGWPPPNVFIFPSQITSGGTTLKVTSYTNGISNGYWANAYYQEVGGSSVYGDLHAYIAPDGSGGQLYGTVNGTSVSANWDSTTSSFVASSNLTVSFQAPSGNLPMASPQYGPPQVEYNTVLIPFVYRDATGSDIYWSQLTGTWVAINSHDSVTVSDGTTGTYDPGAKMFNIAANMAAISADGFSFLGNDGSGGVQIYGGIGYCSDPYVGLTGIITDADLEFLPYAYRYDTSQYYYQLPDGNYAEYFLTSQQPDFTGHFVVGVVQWWTDYQFIINSPTYFFPNVGQIKVINAINGWPAGDLPPFPTPNAIYLNGQEYDLYQVLNAGTQLDAWFYNATNSSDIVCFYMSYSGNGIDIWEPNIRNLDLNFSPAVVAAGQGYSDDGSIYLNFSTPGTPNYGPPQIYWGGYSYTFLGSQNGTDTYYAAAIQNTISINSSDIVATRDGYSGLYNSSTKLFNITGMVAQDGNGNLLGLSPALVLSFPQAVHIQPSGEPTGNATTPGQMILLGNGTTVNSSYIVGRNDGTWFSEFPALTNNSLFLVVDSNGYYSSPLYRYSTSGGNDSTLNPANSTGDSWAPSTNLYPAVLYINGHMATLNSSTSTNNGAGGGTATYLVQPNTGDYFTLTWTWNNGFAGTVTGTYVGTNWTNGTWDGNVFGNLPTGVIIRTSPPPPPVASLTVNSNAPDEIDLSWTLPPLDGTTSLLLQASTDGGVTWSTIATLDPTATSYSAYNLDPTQFYQFQVVTNNDNSSSSSGTTTGSQTATTVSPPGGLTGYVDSNGYMNLSWTASTGNASYIIDRQNIATGEWTVSYGTSTTATYLDTNHGTGGYRYRVSTVATNPTGTWTSDPSAEYPVSRYAIIDLGANNTPNLINNKGQIVFNGNTFWDGGTTTVMGTNSGINATGLNNNGVVVGNYNTVDPVTSLSNLVPFSWSSNGGFSPLTLYNSPRALTSHIQYGLYESVSGVNDAGAIIGYDSEGRAFNNGTGYTFTGFYSHGLNWTLGGGAPTLIGDGVYQGYPDAPDALNAVPDTIETVAAFGAINNNGVSIGSQTTWQTGVYDGVSDFASWDPYMMTSGPYSGLLSNWPNPTTEYGIWQNGNFQSLAGMPWSINNNNQVVGNLASDNSLVMWDGSQGYAPVALPGGPNGTLAYDSPVAMNTRTLVITGTGTVPAVQVISHAKIWEMDPATGQFAPPQSLSDFLPAGAGWSNVSANALNDGGAIVGTATCTGTATTAGSRGVLLAPADFAPAVLKVNSSFNEKKINSTTGYAQPDNYDEDLKIATGHTNAGKITVTKLHQNFFGIKPGTMPNSFFAGDTVTIKKLDNTDPDTTQTEAGTIRLYAIQNLGQSGEQPYPIPISNSGQTLPHSAVPFTTSISTDQPANLVSVLYSDSATIPQGSNVTYYMEGVDPGPITLEYRIHFGSGSTPDMVMTHHFMVCTQQSKAAWMQDIEQEILLQSTNAGSAVDMNSYSLSNNFMTNRPYIQSVYGYYQELFDQKPNLFYWAGLAKLAGSPVYAGMSDMQWAQSNIGLFSLISFGGFTSVGCTYMQGALMQGNSDIFYDLSWQFRAYQASGIWALRYTSENNLDKVNSSDRALDETFWEDIFQGDVQSNNSLVLQGNFELTQREQQFIVQPAWNQIATVPGAATLFSYLATSPVDKTSDASFEAIAGLSGDITQFSQRWPWITDSTRGIWHDWTGLSSSAQSAQTSTDLRTRAAQYSFLPTSLYPIW